MKLLHVSIRAGSRLTIQAAIFTFLSVCLGTIPFVVRGQQMDARGGSLPDLTGLVPYSISVKKVDGVEKIVEKFYTADGGHVARISGDGKVFAYAIDHDREPPIDYLLVDPDGSGAFTQKFGTDETYSIPHWVSD